MIKPMLIVFIGAVITIVGGIVTAAGTYLHNKKSSEKSDRIESGVNSNLSVGQNTSSEVLILKGRVDDLKVQLDGAKEEALINLEKANKAQEELIAYTTGGDSFPIIQIADWDGTKGTFSINNLNPQNHSIYPLSHIVIRIIDVDKYLELKSTMSAVEIKLKHSFVLESEWLAPHSSNDLRVVDFGNFQGERKLNAVIYCNKGTYYQQMIVRNNEGNLSFGTLLVDSQNTPLKIMYLNNFLNEGEVHYPFSDKLIGFVSMDENGNVKID